MKRTIYYLGNKLNAAPRIDELCTDFFGRGASVLDAFAGSGSCSRQFAQSRRVIANDIQSFSNTICKALIKNHLIDESEILFHIQSISESSDLHHILEKYRSIILLEDQISSGDLSNIDDYISLIPIFLTEALSEKNFIITLYAGKYFSFRQSCQLQIAIKYISMLSDPLNNVMTACLISAASISSISIANQFAQPLRLSDKLGGTREPAAKTLPSRIKKDVIEQMRKCSKIYTNNNIHSNNNVCVQEDALIAIERHASSVEFVYADPPYGREHYSRFYHVLETISDKKYHSVRVGNTSMRDDRYQSTFSIRSKCKESFNSLFYRSAYLGLPIALSYADDSAGHPVENRVMQVAELISIARLHYNDVTCLPISSKAFSQLNSRENANELRASKDVLIVARNLD